MFRKYFIIYLLLTLPAIGFAETKIGIVKLDILFQEIPIYKESQTNLKKEFEPKANKLKKLEVKWNKLNDDYLKNERTLSKNDRQKDKKLPTQVTSFIKDF